MPDYSKLSDEELLSLYNQQTSAQQPQAPQATDFSKMSDEQLIQLYKQQQQDAFTENTGNLPVPIEGAPLPKNAPSAPETSSHPLNTNWITPEFTRDFRALTGLDPQRMVVEEENRLVTSTKEALDAAVSAGVLKPDFQNPDPSTYQAFQSQWDAYKSEMEPSVLGAMYRGAKGNALATAGAIFGAAAASPTGLVGMIPAGMAGGAVGATAQELLFPKTTEDRAIDAFDQQQKLTRNARLAGEILPQLVTMKPSASMLKGAVALSPQALKQLGVTFGLSVGIPAGIDVLKGNKIDKERIAWNLGSSMLLSPNKFGTYLWDKFARTENAARNVRNRIFDVTVKDKANALQQLSKYDELAQFGVKPLSGEVVGSEDLIAFQQAMKNQDTAIRQRALDNEAAIAKAIHSNLPEPQTAKPEATRAFIEHQHEVIDAAAIATRDNLLAKGDQDAAQIIANAHTQSQALNALRDQGIVSAEAAHALAGERYTQAAEAIDSLRGTSRAPSLRTNTLLEKAKEASTAIANDLFDSLPLGAQTDFEFTHKAAKAALSEYSKNENVSGLIRNMVKNYAPKLNKKGQLVRPKASLKVLGKDLNAITEAISVANEARQSNQARILKMVKDGIEKDFEAAGNMWEEVANVRAYYHEHSKKFLHGTLGAMISAAPNADPDVRLGRILFSENSGTKGLTSPEQLRLSLKGDASAVASVTEFMLNEMAQNGGRTSAALQKWYESDKIQRIMQAFPEARSYIVDHIMEMQDLEAISRRTKLAEDKARGVKEAKPNPVELEQAKMVKENAAIRAKDAYKQQQQVKESAAFQAFYKKSEANAIEAILKSNHPNETAAQILDIVKQDATGDALLGYQNAVKKAFKTMVRKNGRELGAINDVNRPLQADELAISLSKANEVLVNGSVWRGILETVLPPNELAALDTVRRQLAVIERPARASGGQSPTAPQGAFSQEMRNEMDKNIVGFLSRVARGNRTDSVISTKTSRFADFLQSIYFGQPSTSGTPPKGMAGKARAFAEEYAGWSGKSLGDRAKEMLSETMLDPNLAVEALSESPTSVRGRAFLRAWFVNRDHLFQDGPNMLPFNQLNTSETQLPNGKWLKDRSTGYYIENKGNKFKVLNFKNERVGIYNSLEEAKNAAVKDYEKPTANISLKRK